jgi:predicted RNase H-like HicB family nuclease
MPVEPIGSREAPCSLEDYEAVPYLLVVESVERGGRWLRRAEYPELPGCVAEAHSAVEALDRLEAERRRVLRELWEHGSPIPVPRPPLRRG